MNKSIRPFRALGALTLSLSLVLLTPLAASAEEVSDPSVQVETVDNLQEQPALPAVDSTPSEISEEFTESSPENNQPVNDPAVENVDSASADDLSVDSQRADTLNTEVTPLAAGSAPVLMTREYQLPKLTPGVLYPLTLTAQDVDGDPVYIRAFNAGLGYGFAPTGTSSGSNGQASASYEIYAAADFLDPLIYVVVEVSDNPSFINSSVTPLRIFVTGYPTLPPTAHPIFVPDIDYRGSVEVDARSTASDPDTEKEGLIIDSFTQPNNGTVTQKDDHTFIVTGDGYAGLDSFTYTLSDGENISAPGVVNLSFVGNTAPEIHWDQNIVLLEGQTVKLHPEVYDFDNVRSNQEVYLDVLSTSVGTTSQEEDFTLVYQAPSKVQTPEEIARIEIQAMDQGLLFSPTVTINIHVLPLPDKGDKVSVEEGETLTFNPSFQYQGRDLVDILILKDPSNGTALNGTVEDLDFTGGKTALLMAPASNDTITYRPAAGFIGTDTLVYAACYQGLDRVCLSSLLTIEVTPKVVVVENPSVTTPVNPALEPNETEPNETVPVAVGVNPGGSQLETSNNSAVPAVTIRKMPKTGFEYLPVVGSALALIAAGTITLLAKRRTNFRK